MTQYNTLNAKRGLPLIGNVLKPSAKSVLLPLAFD